MTQHYQRHEIHSEFRCYVQNPSQENKLTDAVEELVESIWQQEVKKNPHLFNGRLLSLVSYDEQSLIGTFVDYKYHLAQQRRPELASQLAITPISISAMTHTDSAILVGKRSQTVLQYPLYYELVPSGGVDADSMKGDSEIDLGALTMRELSEEAGIEQWMLLSMRPLALIVDKRDHSIEIYMDIVVAEEFVGGEISAKSHEHTELQWVAKSDFANFMKRHEARWLPLSNYLIKHYFA